MNGFSVLIKNKILHRDLKLENLLLKGETIKISDFGLSKFDSTKINRTITGTLPMMAYELLSDQMLKKGYTTKIDLWSLGIVYYKMIMGKYPFQGNNF